MQVSSELEESRDSISETLRWMSHGPQPQVLSYNGYIINGYRFFTKKRDDSSSVQNSDVLVMAKTMQVSSSKDKNPIVSDMSFFGVIQEIWELDYVITKVVIFKCDWVESKNGVKEEDGFTLVDLKKIGHKSEPFILASQAKQVFYVEDGLNTSWSVVIENSKSDFCGPVADHDLEDIILLDRTLVMKDYPEVESLDVIDDDTCLRTDVEGTWIDND